jgi:predicted acetyltransferase
MVFSIKPAEISHKDTIFNLIQGYLTELSGFPDEHPDYKDENGIYLYPYLDAYWEEDSRFPYLLFSDSALAGFALVRREGDHWEMSEYYVIPEFKRRGLAEACAKAIFQKHTGKWRIGFNKHNQPSRSLWYKLADNLASVDVEKGEADTSHDYIQFFM